MLLTDNALLATCVQLTIACYGDTALLATYVQLTTACDGDKHAADRQCTAGHLCPTNNCMLR